MLERKEMKNTTLKRTRNITISCAFIFVLALIFMTQPVSACQINGNYCNGSALGTVYHDCDFSTITAPPNAFGNGGPKQNPYYTFSITYYANGGTFLNYETKQPLSRSYLFEHASQYGGTNSIKIYVKPPCRMYNTDTKEYFTLIPPPGKKFNGWQIYPLTFGDLYWAPVGVLLNTLRPSYGTYELYASWVDEDTAKYSVTYDPNEGENEPVTESADKENAIVVKNLDFTRAGYIFNGWNSSPDGSGLDYAAGEKIYLSADITLYAQWKAKEYVIYYYYEWYNPPLTEPIFTGMPYIVKGPLGDPMPGFKFSHWNTLSSGSGINYYPGQTIIPSIDITLYAQWTLASSIIYDPNDGDGSAIADFGDDGIFVVKDSLFTRSGYTFLGWGLSPANGFILPQGMIIGGLSGALTLYAQWELDDNPPEPMIGITYETNTGPGNPSGTPFTEYAVESGAIIVSPTCPFTNPGCLFVGWNTNADGYGISYYPGMNITISAPLTLYAQWVQIVVPT